MITKKKTLHNKCMKLYIERSEDAAHTYILKFADKDIIISDGRVVE